MKSEKDWWGRRLVDSLAARRDNPQGRGALADLRRALQRPPGEDANVFRYVVPHLPGERGWTETAAFLVASLFAAHPDAGGSGDIGAAFRRLADKTNSESVERRFIALLNADAQDLAPHLRQAVSLLKANAVPVDWEQLLKDLLAWDHPDGYVRRNWARGFWGWVAKDVEAEGKPTDQPASAAA